MRVDRVIPTLMQDRQPNLKLKFDVPYLNLYVCTEIKLLLLIVLVYASKHQAQFPCSLGMLSNAKTSIKHNVIYEI